MLSWAMLVYPAECPPLPQIEPRSAGSDFERTPKTWHSADNLTYHRTESSSLLSKCHINKEDESRKASKGMDGTQGR